jgi:imidazolonepropionase-like amidohydrolase
MSPIRHPRARLLAAALAAAPLALPVSSAVAQQPTPATPAAGTPLPRPVVVITDVTVLPMDRERRLTGQSVVVRDGRIVEVGPAARVKAPAGATVVDGRGKFLMPGLAEMHAHVPPGAATAQGLEDLMLLYVANGVTTIRGMLGAAYQLPLRDRLARGEIVGPTFYVGAPSLNGNSAPTPDSAAKLVRAHKAAGYDFLKIHPGLTREAYDAMVRTSNEVGITWAGHIPDAVGVRHAIASRQSTIDHIDGYLEAAAGITTNALAQQGGTFADFVAKVDTTQFRELARQTRAAGVWNVPTAFLWETFFSPTPAESLLAMPELKYVSAQTRNAWGNAKRQRLQAMVDQQVPSAAQLRYLALRRQMLKALADAGAPLLMGTDSPQVFNVPGFALHRELRVAIQAGLTPWQVLESGTRNVGRYANEVLKANDAFGTVAPGQRADLVLLDADPLLDVANLQRRAGVMVNGRWLPWSELQPKLDALAERHRQTAAN